MGTLWSCSNIHQLKLICWSSTWSYCQLKKTAHQSHELKVLFGAIWGLQPRRQHLKQLWETVPKTKGEGQYTSNSGEGGVHAIKHVYFLESFCWSHDASACREKQSSPWKILVLFYVIWVKVIERVQK